MFQHDTPDGRARHDRNHDAVYVTTLRHSPDLFRRFWAALTGAQQEQVRRQLANGGATTDELRGLEGER